MRKMWVERARKAEFVLLRVLHLQIFDYAVENRFLLNFLSCACPNISVSFEKEKTLMLWISSSSSILVFAMKTFCGVQDTFLDNSKVGSR